MIERDVVPLSQTCGGDGHAGHELNIAESLEKHTSELMYPFPRALIASDDCFSRKRGTCQSPQLFQSLDKGLSVIGTVRMDQGCHTGEETCDDK